jgi:hypothetical protein
LEVKAMSFEDSQLSRWLSMANVRAKKSVKSKTLEAAKAGKCLVCGEKSWQRGLCCKHYQQYYRTKMALPKRERIQFELDQIEAGRVLVAGQIAEIRRPNPFAPESEVAS